MLQLPWGIAAVSAPPVPHSPVSLAEQSAPLGRRVSGDGVLREVCTKSDVQLLDIDYEPQSRSASNK